MHLPQRFLAVACFAGWMSSGFGPSWTNAVAAAPLQPLPRIKLDPHHPGFITEAGKPFLPFGVNYYRPGTGWAPQLWKQFDAEATRRDFALMKKLGVNCVRVFLTYGSFYTRPGGLDADGLAKFDQFLKLAEQAGIYVHPTGPDHWEGLPAWARTDRVADETVLQALETFWRLFAARYRGRTVIFAYDLLNEPSVSWNTPALRQRWPVWLKAKYQSVNALRAAWNWPENRELAWDQLPVPDPKPAAGSRLLLDYQHFREHIAEEWTRRQTTIIKAQDPAALVTVGLIQWSVPVLLPGVQHYSGFRPGRVAPWLDFLEVHFYPLEHGFYEYNGAEAERRNLAYLQRVVGETARPGKPVVLAEFGWYGGGRLTIDHGRHPPATEAQQAHWCRRVIQTTTGLACGWLNWGLYDQPEARDVSQLTGLVQPDGTIKQWGRTFRELAGQFTRPPITQPAPHPAPAFSWDKALTAPQRRLR